MAFPWSHWSPALPYPTNAVETPEDEMIRKQQTEEKLRDIVKVCDCDHPKAEPNRQSRLDQGYVERASNEENRYAEPVELDTIRTYAAHP
jgi:hypothetical protein